jgi:hypothetical protein
MTGRAAWLLPSCWCLRRYPGAGTGHIRRKDPTVAREPKRAIYHVTPADGGGEADKKWEVQHKEGSRSVREPHRTQREAIGSARQQTKEHEPSQVVVHGRDGRIRTEYTYGSDPRNIPG